MAEIKRKPSLSRLKYIFKLYLFSLSQQSLNRRHSSLSAHKNKLNKIIIRDLTLNYDAKAVFNLCLAFGKFDYFIHHHDYDIHCHSNANDTQLYMLNSSPGFNWH